MKIEQKNNLFSNIDFLLKRKGMKKSELETTAGFSVGYLSRFKSGDANNLPSVSFLDSVSTQLGTDIETLLNCDLSKEAYSDRYLINLLNKLIGDTKSRKLRWVSFSAEKRANRMIYNTNHYFYKKDLSFDSTETSMEEMDGIMEPSAENVTTFKDTLCFKPADQYWGYGWCSDLSEPFVSNFASTTRLSENVILAFVPLGFYYKDHPFESDPYVCRTLWVLGDEEDPLVLEDEASQALIQLLDQLEKAIEDSEFYISSKNKSALDSYLHQEFEYD